MKPAPRNVVLNVGTLHRREEQIVCSVCIPELVERRAVFVFVLPEPYRIRSERPRNVGLTDAVLVATPPLGPLVGRTHARTTDGIGQLEQSDLGRAVDEVVAAGRSPRRGHVAHRLAAVVAVVFADQHVLLVG